MGKKLLSLIALITLCVSMFAITNMCIKLNDGTVVKYNIDDVEEVYYEGEETQEIVTCVKQKDGSVVKYGIGNIDEVYYEDEDETKDREEQEDSHESVDLGLPSGLKWATMNVGASKPEEFGDYFAWGEVAPAPNNDYSLGNSRFTTGPLRNPDSLKTHGIVDEYGNLTDDYDAATVNWGKNWRMPSKSDYYELIEYCTWTWMKMNDIYGYKVESKSNSNWIFLPTAGYRTGTSLVNESCYYSDYSIGRYWSSSVYIFGSNALYFNDKTQDIYGYDRDSGYSVRPVAK